MHTIAYEKSPKIRSFWHA